MCLGPEARSSRKPYLLDLFEIGLSFLFKKERYKWEDTEAFENLTKMSDRLKAKAFILVFICTLSLERKWGSLSRSEMIIFF